MTKPQLFSIPSFVPWPLLPMAVFQLKMKNLRFPRAFRKPFGFALTRYLFICIGLICASDVLAQGQAGDDTPTGLAGAFGGSIPTGGGSFDPYERNATRSVTDIVVPGAVVPFTFTRTWNSRSSPPQMAIGWRHNFQWDLEDLIAEESGDSDPNSIFKGYNVHYPDGRVVKFNKPPGAPVGAPGTYSPNLGILDRFVVQPDHTAQLFLADGSVVNFSMYDLEHALTSIVDPHGLKITITYEDGMTITEPGQRWIHVSPEQLSIEANTNTCEVTTSLGQHVTYVMAYDTSGSFVYQSGDTIGPDDDRIKTSRGTVIYHDVLDPDTGDEIEAHYVYKTVWPPPQSYQGTRPDPHGRLIWASDPMFNGPLQQIKYVYVDNTSASNGDVSMSAVLEEQWASNYWNPNEPDYHKLGVRISKVEMPPNTWASPEYYTRLQSTGDGGLRTISYFNATLGHGQTLADHFTDFTNELTKTERHEYDWDHYFQTPIKITDARQKFTVQTLDPALGHITRETYMDTSYRSWTYTDPAFPYYVGTKTDDLTNPTTYTRDSDTHLVRRIDHPGGSFETFDYNNNFGQITEHRLPSAAVEYYHYDGRGLLQWEYNSVDGWDARKEYTYYQPGEPGGTPDLVKTMTDGRARAAGAPFSTRMTYNGRLQVTKVEYPDTGAPAPMPPPPSLRPAAPRLESPAPTPTPCQYCCDPREDCAQIGPID